MISLESFIETTNSTKNPDTIFRAYEQALAEYGYDRICYSLLTDHPSLNLKAGHGVLRNYSDEWMKHYLDSGYLGVDPVPLFCFRSSLPFTWDWLVDNIQLPRKAMRIMTEAREALLLDGLAVPMHGVGGELAGVGLASSSGNVDVDPNIVAKIRALSMQFHCTFTEHQNIVMDETVIFLTRREKEILSWAAEGKSNSAISGITGLSYHTVRFHISNIYKKLNTSDRTMAVVKALNLGMISPDKVRIPS